MSFYPSEHQENSVEFNPVTHIGVLIIPA